MTKALYEKESKMPKHKYFMSAENPAFGELRNVSPKGNDDVLPPAIPASGTKRKRKN